MQPCLLVVVSLWQFNSFYNEHILSSRCLQAQRKWSFPRFKHTLMSFLPYLSPHQPFQIRKHCHKTLGVKLPSSVICPLFIYVFIKFVLKWGEGSPLSPPPNKVCYARERIYCIIALPASVWNIDECSAAKYISAQLSATIRSIFALCCLLLHLVFNIMSHMAKTPVMQFDLFSYQLLTLSTICDSLLAKMYTHTQAKVLRCAPAVSRWDEWIGAECETLNWAWMSLLHQCLCH